MNKPMPTQADAMRAARRAGMVGAMSEGRIQRAATIPARKGPGSYSRRVKHTLRAD